MSAWDYVEEKIGKKDKAKLKESGFSNYVGNMLWLDLDVREYGYNPLVSEPIDFYLNGKTTLKGYGKTYVELHRHKNGKISMEIGGFSATKQGLSKYKKSLLKKKTKRRSK